MVLEVGKINGVTFRNEKSVTKPHVDVSDEIKITELPKATADFGVNIPQKYSKLGVSELENGLKIHSYKLANGHRVTIVPMDDSPVTVKNYVNVGSMNETDDIKGISHFLEHMAFNGTNGTEGYITLHRGDSFKKIDELGGWTNASTNYSLTDYVNSTPLLDDKDIETQIKVIAAMTEDLKLSSDMIEKEKFPVCSEIDMILDNPSTVAIDQTVRSLFNVTSSADELVGGSVNHIQNLDRQKVLDYYNKYYTPDNMHLVITGNVNPDEVMAIVAKNFRSKKIPQGKRFDTKLTPINNTIRKDFITDKASSSNIVLGFAAHKPNNPKEAVISDILGKYISSAEFGLAEKLRKFGAYPDFGYERISTNPNNPKMFYYAIESSEENVEKILKIVFKKFDGLKIIDNQILENIKNKLMLEHTDILEISSILNNQIGISAFSGGLDYLKDYNAILENINMDDVNDYVRNYLDVSKTAVTVVHSKTTEDEIMRNYKKAKAISFNGRTKSPVNLDKVSVETLGNNYELALSESKNNNVPFEITLKFDIPKNFNSATYLVLNKILAKGTLNKSEKEFNKYLEDNSIDLKAMLIKGELSLMGISSVDNFNRTTAEAFELLYNPRIMEDEIKEAIVQLKDYYSRYDKSSWNLYKEYESVNNPHYNSIPEILSDLDKVTVEDVQNLHKYIMSNSKGIVTMNIPEKYTEIKSKAKKEFSKLDSVLPFEYKLEHIYKENPKSVVLTDPRNVSQAEILQTYKFQTDNSMKDRLTGKIMNSILSSSDSIGLFNSLRERDHLAYRVNSSISGIGDCGEVSLFILTSTDNKDTGITSYDNLQKSLKGFDRQINKLLNSEYTDADLETAKRALKASLMHRESVYSRLNSISGILCHGEKLDYDNRAFEMIDSITREDIDKYSRRVFAGKPVYSIVASRDTLNYNKEFLNKIVEE